MTARSEYQAQALPAPARRKDDGDGAVVYVEANQVMPSNMTSSSLAARLTFGDS